MQEEVRSAVPRTGVVDEREEDGSGESSAGEDDTILGEQSRGDAPPKPDCPAIPSRISRRATGTEAPALADSVRAAPAMGMQKRSGGGRERVVSGLNLTGGGAPVK